MKDVLLAALGFVSERIDAATAAVERDDLSDAAMAIRDAEARLRMLAAEVRP